MATNTVDALAGAARGAIKTLEKRKYVGAIKDIWRRIGGGAKKPQPWPIRKPQPIGKPWPIGKPPKGKKPPFKWPIKKPPYRFQPWPIKKPFGPRKPGSGTQGDILGYENGYPVILK